MRKLNWTTLILMCMVMFSFAAIASAQKYKGASVEPNVLRIKFVDEPAVMQKMEAAYFNSNDGQQPLKASRATRYVEVPGLAKINSLNQTFEVSEMKRVFRPAGKFEARHRAFGLHLWYEISYDGEVDIAEVIQSYAGVSYVQTVNPKFTTQLSGSLPNGSNDPRLSDQWHYENAGGNGGTADADIDLEEAWTIETGNPNVIVAIEDGGIDVDHEDLVGNIWINSGEIPGNGIDDDNNGYVDDINGYNFKENTGAISAHDHGTHVAGTVGAESNNGIGVAGVAGGSGSDDGVRLMSCQVFVGRQGSGFAEAYPYAADNGAVISQNSWGYTSNNSYDQAVLDGIDYFIANAGGPNEAMDGGIVIFAAGNSQTEGNRYPGYYAPTLCVSSLTNSDQKAWYSNYGTWTDIAAPGGETDNVASRGVLSTLPNNQYDYYQGTSMACPHVSGVAALVISNKYGNITPDELRSILVDNVDPIDDLNPNYVGKLGSGRLNAYKALTAGSQVNPPAKASAPIPANEASNVALTAKLEWTAGARTSSHNVYFGTSNPPASIGNQSGTSFDPGTLTANTKYYWRVDEVNSAGTTTGDVWSFTTNDGSSSGEYATIPYSTGFESGSVDSYWVLETQNSYGRLQVTSSNSPRGNYHLTSDVSSNGNFSTNAALLKLNLAGNDQVELTFFWKEFNDENNTEDGVYFSDNGGASFKKVYSLTNGSSSYQEINIDVDAEAAANGLSLSDKFVVKFQQRDNYQISTDGFAFDDISVSSSSSNPSKFPVDLTLNFDDYPQETSWEIKDASGNVLDNGESYSNEPKRATKVISMMLDAGCYDFTITDSYGDGMCCGYGNGSYSVTQGSNVLTSGASFGASETKNFCIAATNEAGLNQENGVTALNNTYTGELKLYPNPIEDYLVISLKEYDNSVYYIRDLTGKSIETGNILEAETRVDVSDYAAGVYIIDININGSIKTMKVVKK